MTHTTLAAIREAAERIPELAVLFKDRCPAVVPMMLGIRDGFIRLLDEAEKDGKCRFVDDHCDQCDTYQYEGDRMRFCPGCGRKIERGKA